VPGAIFFTHINPVISEKIASNTITNTSTTKMVESNTSTTKVVASTTLTSPTANLPIQPARAYGMNGPCNGAFITYPCSSEAALQSIGDAYISTSKCTVGRRIFGLGRRYSAHPHHGYRCPFYTIERPDNYA
jgi:hypothetical protein